MKQIKIILAQLNDYWAEDVNLPSCFLKAMAYKKGLLRKNIDIEILENSIANKSSTEAITKEINLRKPQILGLSLYPWNLLKSLDVIKRVKECRPQIQVVVGGSEVSPDNTYLNSKSLIDIMVRGEGEETFVDIVKYYFGRKLQLQEIRGIMYFEKNKLKINPLRQPLRRLDSISSPYLLGYLKPKRSAIIQIGRGCSQRCSFCSEWIFRKGKVYYFSLKRIADEILLLKRLGVKEIKLEISALNHSFQKLKSICNLIHHLNKENSIVFLAEIRADWLDARSVQLLKLANIKFLEAGLESINPSALRNINRRINLYKFARGINFLKAADIDYVVNLLVGLPGENYKSFIQGINFLRDHKVNIGGIQRVAVSPGSCLRRHAGRFGIKYDSFPPYMVRQTRQMSAAEIKESIAVGTEFVKKQFL